MRGKQKCWILKDIRRRIAEENDIPFVTRECGFQGECRGTCPRCESELRYLEQQLERRAALGKRISVAALCAGIAIGTAACGPVGTGTSPANNSPDDVVDDLSGAVGPDDAGMYETSAQASATAAAAGQDADHHDAGQQECKRFLHYLTSSLYRFRCPLFCFAVIKCSE